MKMSDGLLARLDKLKERYAELGVLLARPEIVSDQNLFRGYSKEHSDLQPAADKYEEYPRTNATLTSAKTCSPQRQTPTCVAC